MINVSFKQWVGILLMPKIEGAHENYLTTEIWEEIHLREIFYGTLIFQQSSMICIGRHVRGHTVAPQVAQARNMNIGEHRHCCVTFKIWGFVWEKTYRFCNLRKWKDFNKNSLPYLKFVFRLSCVVHGPIYGRFMGFYIEKTVYINDYTPMNCAMMFT